jgi:hypothetical protein
MAAKVLRRAPGAGEPLVADLFLRGMASLAAAIIARYHGDGRLVASGLGASGTLALFGGLQGPPIGHPKDSSAVVAVGGLVPRFRERWLGVLS